MSSFTGPGTPRPDANEQLAAERHRDDQEHARQVHEAERARPSWWRRLSAKLTRRP